MSSSVSPFAIQRAFTALAEARERLLEIDANLADDDRAWLDNLEGEAEGDPLAVIDRIVGTIIDAEAMAEAIRTRRTELAERLSRFVRRSERLRDVTRDMLTALEVKRLERATYSASIGTSPPKVRVTDVDKLPDTMKRVTIEPNKIALASALKAGDEIPGASLEGNNTPVLSIRTR